MAKNTKTPIRVLLMNMANYTAGGKGNVIDVPVAFKPLLLTENKGIAGNS